MDPDLWRAINDGRPNGFALTVAEPDHPARLIVPGSFNPAHAGHLAIARIASDRLGHPADFELAVRNVDKPPIEAIDAARRLDGLRAALAGESSPSRLWVTAAPTFAEKARLFPGATFAIGLDTLQRLADPNYHGGDSGHAIALGRLAEHDARFLIFFRQIDAPDGWDDPARYPRLLADRLRFIPRADYGDEDRLASRRLRGEAVP